MSDAVTTAATTRVILYSSSRIALERLTPFSYHPQLITPDRTRARSTTGGASLRARARPAVLAHAQAHAHSRMVVIELPEAYGYVVLANGIVAFVSNFLLAGCASALSQAGAMSAIPSLTRSLPGQKRHQGTPTVRCPAAKLVRRARRAQGCRRFQPRSTRSPKRSRVCHAGRCDVSDGRDQTPVRCCAWHCHDLCWKLLLPIGLRGYKARRQNGALQEGRRRAMPNLPTVGRPPTRLCVCFAQASSGSACY